MSAERNGSPPSELERLLYEALWLVEDQFSAEPLSRAMFPGAFRDKIGRALRVYESRYGAADNISLDAATDLERSLYEALLVIEDEMPWLSAVREKAKPALRTFEARFGALATVPIKPAHLVLVALPGSAVTFIQKSIEATVGADHHRIVGLGGNMRDDIVANALFRLVDHKCAVVAEHFPANPRNLALLHDAGIKRIALLVRDPRDAVVSWREYLEQADIGEPWARAHLRASGLTSSGYFAEKAEAQMRDLIDHTFPAMQEWLAGWAATIDRAPYSTPIRIHLLRHEDLRKDPAKQLKELLRFFGHHVTPVLPSDGRLDADLRRDDLPASQRARLNVLTNPTLLGRFGWTLI